MNVSHVEDEGGTIPLRNRSAFMVNIGTHRLPLSLRDYADYKYSLNIAIKELLRRPGIWHEIFDYNLSPKGTPVRDLVLEPAYGFRPFSNRVNFVIERGSETGRIDAHIVMELEHSHKIRLNVPRFRELFDSELAKRNEYFIANNVTSSENGEILRWPAPHSYVTVNLLGSIQAADAENYIRKSYNTPGVYPSQEAAERKLRSMLVSSIVN